MSGLFGGGAPDTGKQIIPGPVPTKSDAEVQADANAARMRLAALRGRSSTILAGDSTLGAPAGGKTLLGAVS